MIIHLEPDILECEVKWAKVSGGDGISVELFQILKDDAVKVLHSMPASLEASAMAPGVENIQFSFQPKRKAMSKNIHTITQ